MRSISPSISLLVTFFFALPGHYSKKCRHLWASIAFKIPPSFNYGSTFTPSFKYGSIADPQQKQWKSNLSTANHIDYRQCGPGFHFQVYVVPYSYNKQWLASLDPVGNHKFYGTVHILVSATNWLVENWDDLSIRNINTLRLDPLSQFEFVKSADT